MGESVSGAKRELREEMKRSLAALDSEFCDRAAKKLNQQIIELVNKLGTRTVLAWLNHFPGEPDLSEFIDHVLADGLSVYLPRMVGNNSLSFHLVSSNWRDEVSPGKFGVPEPALTLPKLSVETAASPLILVPGLAFDRSGNRLGRGRGFYDRTIQSLTSINPIAIGIGWEVQLLENVPTEPHDSKLSYICTEESLVRCEQG